MRTQLDGEEGTGYFERGRAALSAQGVGHARRFDTLEEARQAMREVREVREVREECGTELACRMRIVSRRPSSGPRTVRSPRPLEVVVVA